MSSSLLESTIEDVKAARDEKMTDQFDVTFAIQNQAAKMIKNGDKEGAIELLTDYSTQQANMWFDTYSDLAKTLLSNYMLGADHGKTWGLQYTDFWNDLSKSEWGQYK